jgi:hypothetical protein
MSAGSPDVHCTGNANWRDLQHHIGLLSTTEGKTW